MKTWTMPHVMIEGFRANEYVAACGKPDDMIPYNDNYWYADLDNPNLGYNSIDYDGPGDGKWNNGTREQANYNSATRATHNHWYTNKDVYVDGPSGARYGESFSNTNYFTKVGTYDIYMTSVHVYFYPVGTASNWPDDRPTPTDEVAFS